MSTERIDENQRVEDILLGSLGFGEDARIVCIETTPGGYRGEGVFADGERFEFACEEDLDELQIWALQRAQKLYNGAPVERKKTD